MHRGEGLPAAAWRHSWPQPPVVNDGTRRADDVCVAVCMYAALKRMYCNSDREPYQILGSVFGCKLAKCVSQCVRSAKNGFNCSLKVWRRLVPSHFIENPTLSQGRMPKTYFHNPGTGPHIGPNRRPLRPFCPRPTAAPLLILASSLCGRECKEKKTHDGNVSDRKQFEREYDMTQAKKEQLKTTFGTMTVIFRYRANKACSFQLQKKKQKRPAPGSTHFPWICTRIRAEWVERVFDRSFKSAQF